MRVRWLLPLATVVLVVGLLVTTQYNADGQACGEVTGAILLSPGYSDGEGGAYQDDLDTCAAAARRKGALALAVAAAGGLASWWVLRRNDRSPAVHPAARSEPS